ncbi:MAG: DUF2911 domain-containing protein [Flavobacteriaceae bacterium]|nr:DUF2911 domain-containing protein [Flavobacteriaceae bacterium]MCY4266519.1 DUF2911 domain-containing protein [Flavobacteriaceae bacterium]MCY4299820.1 DUF2911 domain-containing protein [Flavobacteriaceae bacterium]
MKYLFFSFLMVVAIDFTSGQLQVPQPSPSSTFKQIIGLTEVTVNYSRPSIRGRVIYGDLVPYDKLWRTGANQNTTISFSDDVVFGGIEVPKGSYAIYTKPRKEKWKVILYNKTDNWGLPNSWNDDLVVAEVDAPLVDLEPSLETFLIGVDELHNNGGSLFLAWDDIVASVSIEVPTTEKAISSIEQAMNESPTGHDYYQAASYYQQEGLDAEKALAWIDRAIQENAERYWYHRPRALILANLGRYREAIDAAQSSLKFAEAAGNTDYVRLNEKSIENWSTKLEN